ncbi:hypothetical protein B0O99DRAFT_207403 [Bisporella sp. PMI_857]|nr:hypothetical protein B0O99DRAFT_207403 [Bisporella sp. PMI_857]
MSSYGVPSDEVAEDYIQALQALTMNSRYEISNLTVIAKENTEHALAISEALKNHIKQTSPNKKLPAFYVLDSVVKNVGTPYTLFFGRQLFSTFMEAYGVVDNPTRRKMDEMLKTWKEPVPGSIDTRPVFPPEVTRPIENALIKARTSAVEAHQAQLRSQQQLLGRGRPTSVGPYPQTPTPPGVVRPQHVQPGTQGPPGYNSNYGQQQYPSSGAPGSYPNQMNGQPTHGLPPRPPSQQYPTPPVIQQYPAPPQSQQYPTQQYPSQQYPQQAAGQQYPTQSPVQQYPTQPPTQQYPYQNTPQPYPQSYPQQYGQQSQQYPPPPQQQQYPQTQAPQYNQKNGATSWQQPGGYQAPDSSIETLKSDVAKLIAVSRSQYAQNTSDQGLQTKLKALLDLERILRDQQLPPESIALIRNQVATLSEVAQPPRVASPQAYSPPPPAPVVPVQAPAQPPSLSSLLSSNAIAALLARQSAPPQPAKPQIVAVPSPPRAESKVPSVALSSTPVSDAGALLAKLRASGMLPATTSTPPNLGALLGKVGALTTPPTSRTPLGEIPNDVVLQPASLKMFRPHLISSLYERLGTPCSLCGRRFKGDTEGKIKKATHMDWHFKTNKRMTEAERIGQHRSWYVDELDWIKSREVDEDQKPEGEENNTNPGSTNSSPKKQKQPKDEYIPADSSSSKVCPICQEKFETSYLPEEQEFVWMDAKKVGDRVYHATCYAEAFKDSLNSQAKRGTPDPVLGKRKAEDDHIAVRPKIKSEPES